MMHCDYQLAYCPITYILTLAHADRAFKNDRLTPEYILQLRVPERLRTLSIPWKDEMLGVPCSTSHCRNKIIPFPTILCESNLFVTIHARDLTSWVRVFA